MSNGYREIADAQQRIAAVLATPPPPHATPPASWGLGAIEVWSGGQLVGGDAVEGAATVDADALGHEPPMTETKETNMTTATRQKTEVTIPTTERPLPTVDLTLDLRGVHDLPPPPDQRLPPWALPKVERDPAQAALFPEHIERAAGLWTFLGETRRRCAERAHNGYRYLASQAKPEAEDVALYHALLRWVAWCDACYWLLTAWYAPPHSAPQPRALVLPFALYHEGARGEMVVRELDGLPGKSLLEECLWDWKAWALASGYLEPLEEDSDGAAGGTEA